MNEEQLNAILGTTSEPVQNKYKITSRKDLYEIERLMRIFAISAEQKNKHKLFAIKNLATMRVLYSNN